MKILLAVDGSKPALDAVDLLVKHAGLLRAKPQIDLVTVHLPVPKLPRMGMAVGKEQIARYYQEEGESNLAAARKRLDAAGLTYEPHILVGPIAETIVKHATDAGCELICIGSHGRSELGKAMLGSVATKVLHLSPLPLLLVK